MHKVFLGIGGNIGDKKENFRKVLHLIEKKIGSVISTSSIYETPPWGFRSDDLFWNQVLVVETRLEAEEILWRVQEIEDLFGRQRTEEQYASREMDLDILYFDDLWMETNTLIIPHPKLHERKFVLVPLVEIAPDYKHPLLRLTSLEMLENCRDESMIRKIDEYDKN